MPHILHALNARCEEEIAATHQLCAPFGYECIPWRRRATSQSAPPTASDPRPSSGAAPLPPVKGSEPPLVELADLTVVTLDGAEVEVEPSGPTVVVVVDGCVDEVSAAIDVVVEPSSPIVVVVVGGCVVEVSAAIDVVVEPSSPIVVVVVGARVVVVVGACVVEVSAAIDVVVEPSSPIVVVVVGATVVVVVGACVVEVSAAIDVVVVGATVVDVVDVLVVVEVLHAVDVVVVPWQLRGKYTDVVRVAVAPSGHDASTVSTTVPLTEPGMLETAVVLPEGGTGEV